MSLHEIERNDYYSYDYNDLWATKWGQQAKQAAYRTEPMGLFIFSLPFLIVELWLPYLRKPLDIKKRVASIVIAHYGLACMELYRHTGVNTWLENARNSANILISMSIPDAKGLCWGFPFPWSNNSGILPPNQPAATQSSYGFDLFEQLWLITNDEKYLHLMFNVAQAMNDEYIDLPRPVGMANTYHGRGYGDVVANSISYRIRVFAGALMYGVENYHGKLEGLVEYLLDQQQPDGSWFYGESKKNQFIDHYHTAFVIKNLFRANCVLQSPEIENALRRGTSFYWNNLFDKNGFPKPYAIPPRINIVKYESYDFAECIGLFALLGPTYNFTIDKLNPILMHFLSRFCFRDGKIRFRFYKVPAIKGYPYYRFGMSAATLALAQLLSSPLLNSRGDI